jgi:hypothetical protein
MPKPFVPNFQAFALTLAALLLLHLFQFVLALDLLPQSDVSMAGWYFNLKLEFIEFACLDSSQHNLPMPILTYKMAPFSHACGHKTTINSLTNKK